MRRPKTRGVVVTGTSNEAFVDPIVVGIGRSIDLAYAVAEERCDANEYTAKGLLRTGVAEGESRGFNWGAAVVETINLPTWSVPSDDRR